MDIKYKILIGVVIAAVAWYIIRESLISLNLYLERSSFGKKIIAKRKTKFKFRDPLAPRS